MTTINHIGRSADDLAGPPGEQPEPRTWAEYADEHERAADECDTRFLIDDGEAIHLLAALLTVELPARWQLGLTDAAALFTAAAGVEAWRDSPSACAATPAEFERLLKRARDAQHPTARAITDGFLTRWQAHRDAWAAEELRD